MATMVMSEAQLGSAISECLGRIKDAENAVHGVNREIEQQNDLLAELSAARAGECESLALGKRAAPENYDPKIQSARDRLSGLSAVLRTRERTVVDLKAELAQLHDQQNRIEQERAEELETRETQELIAEMKSALDTRNEIERRFWDGLAKLRGRTYRVARNKHMASDAAMGLQRMWNGMRP